MAYTMLVNVAEMAAALAVVVPKARSKAAKPYSITITYAKAVATVTEPDCCGNPRSTTVVNIAT